MAELNAGYEQLAGSYLFPEIARRSREFAEQNPGVEIYKLGIGDTTLPLTPTVIDALHDAVEAQADAETYSGYGDEQGSAQLRTAIAEDYYRELGVDIDADEVFVSDGAKPDSANIQSIFSPDSVVAVQDPSYPVYVDTAVIGGKTTGHKDGRYEGIVYLDSTEENDFFPKAPEENVDLMYICNPNNPTGATATREQLEELVNYAQENGAVIIYDAAYSSFISDSSLPRSIYEIEGAKNVAIEINSFSKIAGFTGLRLGWTVVPEALTVEGTAEGEVRSRWNRRQSTMFNGASNIVQLGGIAVLSDQGRAESQANIDYYMFNAEKIRAGLNSVGIVTFGGENAPYIWAKTPEGIDSWGFFDKLMQEAHVVGTPGVGFGRNGEGYFRLSAFGNHLKTAEAVESIQDNLQL